MRVKYSLYSVCMVESKKTPCEYLGCDKPSRSRKLCEGHYGQLRRGVELKPLINWADLDCRGPKCMRKAAHRSGYCRAHHGQKTKHGRVWALGDRDAAPARRPKGKHKPSGLVCVLDGCDLPGNPGSGYYPRHRQLDAHLKTRYGLSLVGRTELLRQQGCVCAICKRPEDEAGGSKLHVDHCHTTGAVRGLLCGNCNRALGLFRDDPGVMAEAIRYIRTTDCEG